jgi:two-component system, probable response regulator PhcQ
MRRVLLIDDEGLVLRALQRTIRPLFQARDVRLETFTDPELALLRCGEVSFDVVMSDYRMPAINGADFLQFVKRLQPDAVRIVLSASTDFAEVSNAINRAEVFRYVAKPWEAEELRSMLVLAFERFDQSRDIRRRLEEEHAPQLSAAELELRKLEQEEPGITAVRRDADGSVYLEPDPADGDRPWEK